MEAVVELAMTVAWAKVAAVEWGEATGARCIRRKDMLPSPVDRCEKWGESRPGAHLGCSLSSSWVVQSLGFGGGGDGGINSSLFKPC